MASYKQATGTGNKWQLKAQKYIGQRFVRLIVIEILPPKNQMTFVKCECDCGNTHIASIKSIKKGDTKSCGCWNREQIGNRRRTHGDSYTPLFSLWQKMRFRCYNPNDKSYKNYGGRGIYVCQAWHSYPVFKKWALSHGYKEGLQLDRKRNNCIYKPSNCRFVTCKVNNNNRRSNTYLKYKGKTLTISEWADVTGLKGYTISSRLRIMGWSIEKSLTTPVRIGNYNKPKI